MPNEPNEREISETPSDRETAEELNKKIVRIFELCARDEVTLKWACDKMAEVTNAALSAVRADAEENAKHFKRMYEDADVEVKRLRTRVKELEDVEDAAREADIEIRNLIDALQKSEAWRAKRDKPFTGYDTSKGLNIAQRLRYLIRTLVTEGEPEEVGSDGE